MPCRWVLLRFLLCKDFKISSVVVIIVGRSIERFTERQIGTRADVIQFDEQDVGKVLDLVSSFSASLSGQSRKQASSQAYKLSQ